MTNAEIEALERDVEQARGRLVADLAVLRSAGTLSDLKRDVTEEVTRTKDEFVGRAKDAARQRAEGVLDGIKARVAANPGAALAIGAGLAWRLYRHPPIASFLVGAGLVSLFRTDPQHPAVGADMAARAVDYAGTARDRLSEFRQSETAGQIGEMAATARTRAGETAAQLGRIAGAAKERAGELAETATERASELAETATEHAGELASAATRQVGDLADRAGELAETARRRLGAWQADSGNEYGEPTSYPFDTPGTWSRNERNIDFGPDRSMNDRDKYLLGAAGLAIAAAIGIAYQRRSTEETPRLDR